MKKTVISLIFFLLITAIYYGCSKKLPAELAYPTATYTPVITPMPTVTPSLYGRIVLITFINSALLTMDGDGGNMAAVNNPSNFMNLVTDVFSVDWSPDGKKIAFDKWGGGIYIIDAAGGTPAALSTGSFPAWSPDGSKIASCKGMNGTLQIFAMRSDGSNEIRLTDNSYNDLYPTWSSDGKKIAFQSDRDGHFEIYTMNSDGTGQKRITFGVNDNITPDWSWSVNKIVFRDYVRGICIMDPDGTNETTVYMAGYPNPKWSPDGSKIGFIVSALPHILIWVINADGTNLHAIMPTDTLDPIGFDWI